MKFRLIYGQHSDANGNYSAGDIVESDSDLSLLRNGDNPRFERVDVPAPMPAPVVVPEPVPVIVPEPLPEPEPETPTV